MPASFLFALAVVATSPEAPATVIPAFDKDPTVMTQSEIRAFNLGRDKKDPNYIRCKRFEETGSLIKRTLTCHTNAQWEKEFLEGNQNARDTVDRMTPKLINGHE